MCSFRPGRMHSEMPCTCLSLCTSYGYLCRRLSNTDFVWQLSIQGLGSNWSTNRKQKIEIVGRKKKEKGIKKANISLPPSHGALNEKPNMGRERLWFSWKVCICRNEVSEEAGFPQGAAQHEPISYHFPLPDMICFECTNAERAPQTWSQFKMKSQHTSLTNCHPPHKD